MSEPKHTGPWRALTFLLLALVLVQADAFPPREALRRFAEERVLPLARIARARARALRARVGDCLVQEQWLWGAASSDFRVTAFRTAKPSQSLLK